MIKKRYLILSPLVVVLLYYVYIECTLSVARENADSITWNGERYVYASVEYVSSFDKNPEAIPCKEGVRLARTQTGLDIYSYVEGDTQFNYIYLDNFLDSELYVKESFYKEQRSRPDYKRLVCE